MDTSKVKSSQDNIALLTKTEQLMTIPDEMTTNYPYDKLMQEDISIISDCDTSYDLNASILKLPIYRASLFYNDLQYIFDNVVQELDETEEESAESQINIVKDLMV